MDIVKNTLQYYMPGMEYVNSFEEETMAIVPDTQQDMLCVNLCSGSIDVQERSIVKDTVRIAGVVNCVAVYSPVEGDNLGVLETSIPFSYTVDLKDIGENDRVVIDAKLINLSASMVNPRKLNAKARIEICSKVFKFCSNEYIEDIVSAKDEGINCLSSCDKIDPISYIAEKKTVINDEIRVNNPDLNDTSILIAQENRWINEDVKVLTNKIMIRGRIEIEISAISKEGKFIGKSRYSVPISQMIECEGLRSEDKVEICYIPSREEVKIFTESDNISNIEISFAAQTVCLVRQEIEITSVRDVFSTYYDLVSESFDLGMLKRNEEIIAEKEIDDKVILESHPLKIVHISAVCERMPVAKNERVTEAAIQLNIIYLDEDHTVRSEIKRICTEIKLPDAFINDGWCRVECSEVTAVPGDDEKVTVSSKIKAFTEKTVDGTSVVAECILDRNRPRHLNEKASMIIRRSNKEERFWDIAKKYGISPYAVASANKADVLDIPEQGRMLLIPMVRQ